MDNHQSSQPGNAAPVQERPEHDAIVNARRRLELQKQAVGDRHPDFATGLNQLAMLLIMHGDPDKSEPLLRQALAIRKDALGEQHPDYATNLSSLAGLLWARGDLDGAEPLMRQALAIRWDVLGSEHPKTMASLNSLEQLLRAKKDWEGVERLPVAAAPGNSPVASPSEPVVPPSSTPAPVDAAAAVTPTVPPSESEAVETQTQTPEAIPIAPGTEQAGAAPVPAAPESRTREELIARHEALAARFSRAGEQLAEQAEGWKSGGAPPTPALIEELDACGTTFEQLRGDAVRLADSLGTAVDSSLLTNLQEIANLLRVLAEAEGRQAQLEALRGQALRTLDRILTLTTPDRTEFAPLVECQAKARAIHASLAAAPVLDLPEEATRLAEGDHPFHALLTLVEGEGLDDDVWSSSLGTVETEFGKPLSIAVARSKIIQP